MTVLTQRVAATAGENDDWRGLVHLASLASWSLSLDKAIRKGGPYWVPVIFGGLGHLIAWLS